MVQRTHSAGEVVGRFEAFAREDPSVDRWALYRDCRHEPVFYSDALGAWVLTRYDDVVEVLRDGERFATLDRGPGSTVYGRTILHMRGDEHTKKRRIAARQMQSARATERIETFLVGACGRLTGALPMAPDPVDLKKAYCMWIPLLVIGELMGVAEPERFCDWYGTISAGSMSSIGHPERRERALVAVAELGEFLRPLIEERRARPGDDMISDYCRAEYDGRPVPDAEIVAIAGLLLTAGVETTERGLASLFCHLVEHREIWDTVRDDRTLVESTAVEGLRMMPPIHAVTRQATVDATFGDRTVPAGQNLFVVIASANRDETRFAQGEHFDPARFVDDPGRQYTAAGRILPFGGGMHHCAGSHLVRVEMRQAINALMDRVAHATFADGVPETVGFLLRSPATLDVVLTPAS